MAFFFPSSSKELPVLCTPEASGVVKKVDLKAMHRSWKTEEQKCRWGPACLFLYLLESAFHVGSLRELLMVATEDKAEMPLAAFAAAWENEPFPSNRCHELFPEWLSWTGSLGAVETWSHLSWSASLHEMCSSRLEQSLLCLS